MTGTIEHTMPLRLTPKQIAQTWCSLKSDEQAEFYAHLHRIAGHLLCMQAAYITHGIADTDNTDARDGWQTLQGHASDYLRDAIEIRAGNAKREISALAKAAMQQ
jgi:hypothetical protein